MTLDALPWMQVHTNLKNSGEHNLSLVTGIITYQREKPCRIYRPSRRNTRLAELGAKAVYELPFNADMAAMTDEDFARDVLKDGIGASHVTGMAVANRRHSTAWRRDAPTTFRRGMRKLCRGRRGLRPRRILPPVAQTFSSQPHPYGQCWCDAGTDRR